jgi:hypothetical protein
MGDLPPSTQRISATLSTDLLNDIFFDIMKEHGVTDPHTSLGKYIEQKLRPLVPHRNSQITPDSNED